MTWWLLLAMAIPGGGWLLLNLIIGLLAIRKTRIMEANDKEKGSNE